MRFATLHIMSAGASLSRTAAQERTNLQESTAFRILGGD